MSDLKLDIERSDDSVRIGLEGELDISDVPRVEQDLREVERDRPPLLVLDLRKLSFIDSSGLRLILEADARARRESRQLTLIRGPEQVHRIFLIALLDKRLDFREPEDGEAGGHG